MQIPVRKLHDGVEIPVIGFGTWQVEAGEEAVKSVECAIKAGYPSIDTAAGYENEQSVGQAIKNMGVDRKDLFITTKLFNDCHGYDKTMAAFDKSMKNLDMEYLDLYLIHWPGKDKYVDTWKAFIELQKQGRIRTIGVSNFYDVHIEKLIAETGVKPTVNQVETHPYLFQPQAVDYCRKNDILLEAWSPLMSGKEALTDPVIVEVAKKYNKSAAQTILRWHIQNGFRVIPKSVTPKRIEENIQVFDFELADDDMKKIDALQAKNVRTGPDPMTFMKFFD